MNMDMNLPLKFKIGNINLANLNVWLELSSTIKFSFTEAVEISEQEDLGLTSFYEHTRATTTYRATLSENNLNTSQGYKEKNTLPRLLAG